MRWSLVAAFVAVGCAAGLACVPLSERILLANGWNTDAATVFLAVCLPALGLLCAAMGAVAPRAWWLFGVPPIVAYAAAS